MADGTYSDEAPDASIGERLANAVRKTVSGVAKYASPSSVSQIKGRTDADVEAASGGPDDEVIGRMKAAQSSDKDNSYAY